jgi:ADP-L-glycero-D-manno-heptose 6-epimerase
MIIIVTGAYGFIGSNLVKALNARGFTDIIAVDNLTNGAKAQNLVDCEILDFVDKEDFIRAIENGDYDNQVDYIFHQGACSSTTIQDGKYMMDNNYEYSSILLEYAQKNEVPMLYASSAAVYGAKTEFIEDRRFEAPLNVYGYSKFLFDQMVRRYFNSGLSAPIVGLRYFNVYGMQEAHKDRMASVVLHNYNQYNVHGKVQLFEGCQGYANGAQVRDFISVEDVVKVNLFFFDNYLNDTEEISGIFNCGTGVARSFNDLSLSVINACRQNEQLPLLSISEAVQAGIIEYIPFPADLSGRYQCYTQASLDRLRETGFIGEFLTLEDGVSNYINWLITASK